MATLKLVLNCEASDIMYRDGWYYLLATHGICCRGAGSGYNIRVGRAKKVPVRFWTPTASIWSKAATNY